MNTKQILLSFLLLGLGAISTHTFTMQENDKKIYLSDLKPLLNVALGYLTFNGLTTALNRGKIPYYIDNLPITGLFYKCLEGEFIYPGFEAKTVYQGAGIAALGLIAVNTNYIQKISETLKAPSNVLFNEKNKNNLEKTTK